MSDVQAWVGILTPTLALIGTLIVVWATRGKTKTDYKTSFDERVDKRMGEYTDRLEARLEKAETSNGELETRVEHLEDAQEEATKREKALYRYTTQLRDHILSGRNPPPPAIPEELQEWYESYEVGKGLS